MRIGNLSRKAVIAVLVWCTAYVAYSETNYGHTDYLSPIEDVMKDWHLCGVTDAEELGLIDSIRGLPVSKVGKVTRGEESLALLAQDGHKEFLIRMAEKMFPYYLDFEMNEDSNGVLRMKKGKGGLLGLLARDVPSIIMPEHWRPDIKSRAIAMGNDVKGVFKALGDALRHYDNSDENLSAGMMNACKKSIAKMLVGVFSLEELNNIMAVVNNADVDNALRIFSSSMVGGSDELKDIRRKANSLMSSLINRNSELHSLIMGRVEEGSVDYPFVCIAIGMLFFISNMAYELGDSFLFVGNSENRFKISDGAAFYAKKIIFVLEVASAKGVKAIESEYGIDGGKREQCEFAGEDRSPPQYPGSGDGADRFSDGRGGGQSRPFQRSPFSSQMRGTSRQLQQQQNLHPRYSNRPGSSYSVSSSASQLSSSNNPMSPSGNNDGSGYRSRVGGRHGRGF